LKNYKRWKNIFSPKDVPTFPKYFIRFTKFYKDAVKDGWCLLIEKIFLLPKGTKVKAIKVF
jgi:hypothetical protein